MAKEIVIRGVCSQSGFGVATVGLIKTARAAGFDVKFVQVNAQEQQHRKGFSDEDLKFLDDITIKDVPAGAFLIDVGSLIYALGVPKPSEDLEKHIIYFTTETTNIHPQYAYMLNNKFDEVWTASNFNKVGAVSSGVHNTVRVLPHYIDLDKFTPDAPKLKIKNLREFNFLMNIDFSFRKGLHLAIPAWLDTFEEDDDTALIIKITNGNVGLENVDRVIKPLQDMLYKMGVGDRPHAPILLFLDKLDSNHIPSLYSTSQCYLSPNLGEGFGLPIAESMACGVPQITSRCGAPLDFMSRKCGYFIDLDEKNPTQPVKDQSLLRRDPHYQGTKIFNINMDSLKEHLHYCYMNQGEMEGKGKEARKRIEKKLNLAKLAGQMKSFIDEASTGPEEISL